MQKLTAAILIIVLAVPALVAAPSLLPRKSPDFTISEPSGKTTSLSALKGRVVVMEFFFVQSEHCTRVMKILNKLNEEMAPRGFQALGVVFDPPRSPNSHGNLIGPAVDNFKITFPIGFSSKADIDSYLGRQPKEVLNIPQIIVIDRAGMIRAASGAAGGDPRLEDEPSLHAMIDGLLNESVSVGTLRK